MNKFDEDLYNFVTTPENFEPIFELSKNFESFKERLIKDFWKKAVDNLNLYIKQTNVPEFNGWIASDIIKSPHTIGISNKEYWKENYKYPSVGTCFLNWGDGRIIVGLFFNSDEKIKGLDINKIISYGKKNISNNWKLAPLGYALPIYKFMSDNFNTYETLRKILPFEGDFLAKEYSDAIVSTHIELYPLIEKFGIKF